MPFKVAAVGDVMVTRTLEGSMAKPGVQALRRILTGADYVAGNLEIPLCAGGTQQEKFVAHRASPAIVPFLAEMGFDSLVVANNHCMDYGPEGLLESIAHLNEAGITPIGGGRNLAEALQVSYVGNDQARVALLAVSALLPLGAGAAENRPGIAPIRVETSFDIDPHGLMEQPGTPPVIRNTISEDDFARLAAVVEGARREADFVVMFVHWGVGGQQERAPYQQVLGRRLVEAGVDVVVGCHPHAIQEIERYQQGLIFYNLGEFFSQYAGGNYAPHVQALLAKLQPEGSVLRLAFTRGEPVAAELVPIAIDGEGDPSPEGAEKVLAKLASLCEAEYRIENGILRLV